MQRAIGYGCVLLAATLWALLGPVAKFGFEAGMTPLELGFFRAAGGALCFALHARSTSQGHVERRDIPAFLLFGVVGIAVFFGSYQLAVHYSGAAVAAILLYTAPVWVALMSRLFFHEVFSVAKVCALALATAGVSIICITGNTHGTITVPGVIFGLLSGFTYALHYVFGKAYLGRYSTVTLYVWCLPVGALALLPWVDFSPITPTGIFVVLSHSLLSTYAAYYVYCEALKRLEATRVAVVANAEPVVAALLAWLWWGEQLSAYGYTGALLVLSGVMLVMRDDRRSKHKT